MEFLRKKLEILGYNQSLPLPNLVSALLDDLMDLIKTTESLKDAKHRPVVFKLCAAALWGAVKNLKGAANFFRQDEILQFFNRNLLGVPRKFFGLFQGAASQKV
jgi:hypothetical protein